MKSALIALASLALANAVSVASKVSYEGSKVFRLNGGADTAKVKSIISKYKLDVWTGPVKANSHVDVVVPPSLITKFEKETEDIESEIMHEDLGASIADETNYEIYAGTVNSTFRSAFRRFNNLCF